MAIKVPRQELGVAVTDNTLAFRLLLPPVVAALRRVDEFRYMGLMKRYGRLYEAAMAGPKDHMFWDSMSAYAMLEDATDLLNQVAPEGYYFGPRGRGDVSYGFWPRQGEMKL